MNHQTKYLPFILLALVCAAAHGTSPASPYAGEESRAIKALSSDEVQSYLAGKGMGFAKAAELNGYPGPSHVLELADALPLTTEQRARTEALFKTMQAQASALGRELVEEERTLDRAFAGKTVSAGLLQEALLRIGVLQARIRQAHLDAHLAQLAILTPAQISRYESLRGYRQGANPARPGHEAQHQH
jgi:Spy/CpxP family protein refolding chaperone